MEAYIGEIRLFPYMFAPRDWMPCDGRMLRIQENSMLFGAIGNKYGGDGRTTFALPDLRGRAPIGFGGAYKIGATDGSELAKPPMLEHTHKVVASNINGDVRTPVANSLARTGPTGLKNYKKAQGVGATQPDGSMDCVTQSGGDQPHSNMPSHVMLNYMIAVRGEFPMRD